MKIIHLWNLHNYLLSPKIKFLKVRNGFITAIYKIKILINWNYAIY